MFCKGPGGSAVLGAVCLAWAPGPWHACKGWPGAEGVFRHCHRHDQDRAPTRETQKQDRGGGVVHATGLGVTKKMAAGVAAYRLLRAATTADELQASKASDWRPC